MDEREIIDAEFEVVREPTEGLPFRLAPGWLFVLAVIAALGFAVRAAHHPADTAVSAASSSSAAEPSKP